MHTLFNGKIEGVKIPKQKKPKKLENINYYSVPNQNKSKLATNLSLHVKY